MKVLPLKTNLLKKDFDLFDAVKTALLNIKITLKEGSIIVISSKIAALSEGRIVDLRKIKPGRKALNFNRTRYGLKKEDPRLIELILQETKNILPGKMILAFHHGAFLPAAGIDLSNAPQNFAILLPKNPKNTAENLLKKIKKEFKVKKIGVIICDSVCYPMRWGVTGIALAWAGFEGVEDLRGKKDIYGNRLIVTKKAAADSLASAAVFVMGEADEKTPLAIIENAPVKFISFRKVAQKMRPKDCIFGGIYSKKALKII